MKLTKTLWATALTLASLGLHVSASAQEAAIRKNLADRLPQMGKIDEINKTPVAGLYELRVNGTDIFYTDAEGNYLVQGSLIDTKMRRNLTEERVEKLTAIDYSALPMKDAFTIVRGTGKRHLAVFEDPNCGYCKRFERDLAGIKDITVHMFLYPILSPDSAKKSEAVWCAKDKGRAWQDMMVRDVHPASAAASCDTTAVSRNVDFGKRFKITGTPTLVFADGTRVPGAINAQQIEELLAKAKN